MQEISFDIESWTYRNTIRKIEIGYTALGCTVTWGGKFYVDNVRAETVGYNSGDFEYTTENWTADQNISSINTANSAYAFGIPAAYNGNKTLEVVMANTQGQSQRWIKKEFSTPMNFSQFNSFKFAFSAWKGAPGATSYTLYVRFTSKGGETLYQEISFPGDYNPMQQFSIDLTNWVYKNAITKIQIGYSANGSTQTWGGKFFIDNAKFTK